MLGNNALYPTTTAINYGLFLKFQHVQKFTKLVKSLCYPILHIADSVVDRSRFKMNHCIISEGFIVHVADPDINSK